jgi:hypothetical protein
VFLLFPREGDVFAGREYEDVERGEVRSRRAVGVRTELAQNANAVQVADLVKRRTYRVSFQTNVKDKDIAPQKPLNSVDKNFHRLGITKHVHLEPVILFFLLLPSWCA